MEPIDFEKIRKDEFPAAMRGPYLNAAGLALSPKCVINPMIDFYKFGLERGLAQDFGERVYNFQKQVWSKMAELIHTETSEVALARNTSDALSTIANGIRFKPGENVIINDIEFPANVYCWMNLKKKGVKTKMVKNRDGKVLAEDIERSIDKNTRVIAISSISFLNGFKAELEKIGSICNARNIYFVVDAIQQLGVFDLDAKKCHIDMLASGTYKWLMVPDGVGILYVNKEILEEIDVSKVGWWNVKNERDFFEVPGATYELKFKEDTTRFQESHPGIPGIFGLNASLDFIFKIGIQNIAERVMHLTDLLIEGVKDLGIKVASPLEEEYRSGIVLIDPKNKKEAYNEMVKNNIYTSLRGAGIRISPHFYNNKADIEKVLEILDDRRFKNDD